MLDKNHSRPLSQPSSMCPLVVGVTSAWRHSYPCDAWGLRCPLWVCLLNWERTILWLLIGCCEGCRLGKTLSGAYSWSSPPCPELNKSNSKGRAGLGSWHTDVACAMAQRTLQERQGSQARGAPELQKRTQKLRLSVGYSQSMSFPRAPTVPQH